jgi:hypothetical protein
LNATPDIIFTTINGFIKPVAIVVIFGSSSVNEEEITIAKSPPLLKLPRKQQLGGTSILGNVRESAGGDNGRSLLNNHVSHLKTA